MTLGCPTRCLIPRAAGARLDMSRRAAFSLLEVLVAMTIFFIAIFSILELVSASLRNARALRLPGPNVGMAAAQVLTNRLDGSTIIGDFGELHPEFTFEAMPYEIGTNGLWQVDIVLYERSARGVGAAKVHSTLSIQVFDPTASQSGLGAAAGRGGAGGSVRR